jgi:hypothetical protein
LERTAEGYVRCTLQLAQHQPSLVEAWLGPDTWRPGPRRPVAAIRADIDQTLTSLVALRVSGGEATSRHHYLRRQLDALTLAARRLAGESMSFTEEARASLGEDVAKFMERAEPHNSAIAHHHEIAAARAELERRLPGTGRLHERYTRFQREQALPAERARTAVQAGLDVCRRLLRHNLALPDSESVHLEFESGLGVQARALYEGAFLTQVSVDLSGPIDLARVLWLAAHEAYPGHHVQHVFAERDVLASKGWLERALFPAFGSHLLCSEGAAEAGAALLLEGDGFEAACRQVAAAIRVPPRDIAGLVTVHRAVADLDISIVDTARAYLDGEIDTETAVEQLADGALVTNPRQLLFAIERQRTRILAYPVGRRLVQALVNTAPPAERWRRLQTVATTLTLS